MAPDAWVGAQKVLAVFPLAVHFNSLSGQTVQSTHGEKQRCSGTTGWPDIVWRSSATRALLRHEPESVFDSPGRSVRKGQRI